MPDTHTIPWTKAIVAPEQINSTGPADLLATMFAQQRGHMDAYAKIAEENGFDSLTFKDYGDIEDPKVQAALREYAGYSVEELYEAINHLKNKPWKQTLRPVNREEFLEEIADAWHFFIEFHILAGISPTEVFQAYFGKTLKNIERQQNGY